MDAIYQMNRDGLARYCNIRSAKWDNIPGGWFWTGLYDKEYKRLGRGVKAYFLSHSKNRREWRNEIRLRCGFDQSHIDAANLARITPLTRQNARNILHIRSRWF